MSSPASPRWASPSWRRRPPLPRLSLCRLVELVYKVSGRNVDRSTSLASLGRARGLEMAFAITHAPTIAFSTALACHSLANYPSCANSNAQIQTFAISRPGKELLVPSSLPACDGYCVPPRIKPSEATSPLLRRTQPRQRHFQSGAAADIWGAQCLLHSLSSWSE